MSLQKFFGKKCLRWFNKIIQEATVIPYDEVLHLPDEYLQNNTRLRIIKKYLHKYLRLKLHGQQKLEVRKLPIYKVNSGINNSVNNNINDTHGTLNSNINNTINSSINNNISSNINNRILWIFTGKRNVGDAMMDISGRALLKGKGCQIDLLTLPELWKLFKDDDVFKKNIEIICHKIAPINDMMMMVIDPLGVLSKISTHISNIFCTIAVEMARNAPIGKSNRTYFFIIPPI